MRTHDDRLRALSWDRRNDTALCPGVRKRLRARLRSRRNVALCHGKKPGRGLLSCSSAIISVVVVAEGLQVGLDVGAAELCGESLDGGALGQGGGISNGLALLDIAGARGEVGPVSHIEEVGTLLRIVSLGVT